MMFDTMRTGSAIGYTVLVAVAVVAFAIGFTGEPTETMPAERDDATGVKTFDSSDDFRAYLAKASRSSGYSTVRGARDTAELQRAQESAALDKGGGGSASPDRVSGTNVQVEGIDEPDVVKTDGESIFYARGRYGRLNTTILDAFPPENISVTSSLDAAGEMLLVDDTLVVLGDGRLHGFDVADRSSPSRRWSVTLNGSVETARLHDGEVFLVTKDAVHSDRPCPIRPLSGDEDVVIPCDRIYHPPEPSGSQAAYSVMRMNPASGEVDDAVSFTGSSRNTVVYMSKDDLYLTYREQESETDIMMSFLMEEIDDMLSETARERIERLRSYNLSDRAKRVELEAIVEDWRGSLSDDRRREVETELENRLANYSKEHMREHVKTGIVSIGLESMDVASQGTVPGALLNQFSMDAYEGTLRVATTVNGVLGAVESENDVYTLDAETLDIQGSVKGMGLNERIYSVRFLGDTGYVVTFRRIDPFHVLDLSSPEEPVLQGELKLPGFSSYLHPLDEGRVLGIGEEQGNVKAVIFDVSDPTDPKTADTYRLDEYQSDVNSNHRAFLIDREHDVFFLPGQKGGYVFSYTDGLELVKAVDVSNVERARYFDDYLYVIAENEIVVLDETDWSVVRRVSLPAIEHGYGRPVEPRIDERVVR